MKRVLVFVLLLALLLPTPVLQAQAAISEAAAQELERSRKVIADASAMQFPGDSTDVELPCPICGETVVWYAWYLDAEVNTQQNRRLENRHLYLAGDMVGTDIYDPKSNTGGFMFVTGTDNKHSVIHLNGYNINASQGVVSVDDGEVSIIGDGDVWGRRNNKDFGSSLDVRDGEELNIYGGTYYRSSPQPLVKIVEEGTVNLYGGKFVGNDSQEASTVRVEDGTCNIYGGRLESGYGSREGSNLTVEPEGTAVIADGVLVGGKDGVGGNILTSGTLEIHGGEISGNVKQMDGSLTITGGQFDSAILAENMTIEGGAFSTDITKFVETGFKIRRMEDYYIVYFGGASATEWLWMCAIAGGVVVVLVVVIVAVWVAGKKKKRQTEPEEA